VHGVVASGMAGQEPWLERQTDSTSSYARRRPALPEGLEWHCACLRTEAFRRRLCCLGLIDPRCRAIPVPHDRGQTCVLDQWWNGLRQDHSAVKTLLGWRIAADPDGSSMLRTDPPPRMCKPLGQEHAEGMTDRDDFLAWVKSTLYEAEVAIHSRRRGPTPGDLVPQRACEHPGCDAQRLWPA
jgi:hypothetical protein